MFFNPQNCCSKYGEWIKLNAIFPNENIFLGKISRYGHSRYTANVSRRLTRSVSSSLREKKGKICISKMAPMLSNFYTLFVWLRVSVCAFKYFNVWMCSCMYVYTLCTVNVLLTRTKADTLSCSEACSSVCETVCVPMVEMVTFVRRLKPGIGGSSTGLLLRLYSICVVYQ